jgi:hypothetical protein
MSPRFLDMVLGCRYKELRFWCVLGAYQTSKGRYSNLRCCSVDVECPPARSHVCWRPGPQPLALLGGGGAFRRWG